MPLQSYLNDSVRKALAERIVHLIRGTDGSAEGAFGELAGDVFAFQRERNEPFASLCEAQGWGQGRPGELWEFPFVPTDAFKHYRIACFAESPDEIRFHTSGTTEGRPGVHVLPNTELYDAAAMVRFAEAMNVRENEFYFLSLTNSPCELPHSSLVHMIERAGREFGAERKVDYFWNERGTDLSALAIAIGESRGRGRSVLLTTTAFALVDCIDRAAQEGLELRLPESSRIMETGGYKGRSRVVDRDELYRETSRLFGVPVCAIVNEYGMTEMSSQFYDRVEDNKSEEGREGDVVGAANYTESPRIKTVPPWVRSLVLDPVTLRPTAYGSTGILAHIDLANLDSCAFLLTSDAARAMDGGFELLGRLSEVEARGCSLDYEVTQI